MKSIEVLKANGDPVSFQEEKLFYSLMKSGASKEDARQVVNEVVKSYVLASLPKRIIGKSIQP